MLNAVAYDQGAVYVAGTSTCNTLNLTGPSTISGARAANAQTDAIVVSFTRDGTAAIWYTFISGSDPGQRSRHRGGRSHPQSFLGQPHRAARHLPGWPDVSTDLAADDTAANHYQGNGDGFIVRLTGTVLTRPAARSMWAARMPTRPPAWRFAARAAAAAPATIARTMCMSGHVRCSP